MTLIVHDRDIAPFSWMKCIVISEKDLDENGREILCLLYTSSKVEVEYGIPQGLCNIITGAVGGLLILPLAPAL